MKQPYKQVERIVCAANRNAVTCELILGVRHFDNIIHFNLDELNKSACLNLNEVKCNQYKYGWGNE